MPIGGTGLLRQQLGPGVLRVIQNEGNKLCDRLLALVARRIRLADSGSRITSDTQQRKEILVEYETEN